MTARKACLLLSVASLLLGGLLVAVLMLTPLQGVLFAALAVAGLVCLGLSVLSFTAALHVKPRQMLGDNVAIALLDALLSAL